MVDDVWIHHARLFFAAHRRRCVCGQHQSAVGHAADRSDEGCANTAFRPAGLAQASGRLVRSVLHRPSFRIHSARVDDSGREQGDVLRYERRRRARLLYPRHRHQYDGRARLGQFAAAYVYAPCIDHQDMFAKIEVQ